MVTLKTIQRKREEEEEEEELLRRQETAPVRDSATPVPSGEELSPSEANLDPDEEPDLREKLNMTRREREKPGEEPDQREITRRENEKTSTETPETALETDPEKDPGPEEREEGELAPQSSPTQTGQKVAPNDPAPVMNQTKSKNSLPSEMNVRKLGASAPRHSRENGKTQKLKKTLGTVPCHHRHLFTKPSPQAMKRPQPIPPAHPETQAMTI
jgi:hypothetical protein